MQGLNMQNEVKLRLTRSSFRASPHCCSALDCLPRRPEQSARKILRRLLDVHTMQPDEPHQNSALALAIG